MSDQPRSTIYLDVDDDITAILGKLAESEHNQVALVVPKRSSVLQSVVNMKLVKKAAKEAGRQPILISEDPIIKNIAGSQQMLVAGNLQAEPKIPEVDRIAQTSLPSDVIEGEAAEETPLAPAATSHPPAIKNEATESKLAPSPSATGKKTKDKKRIPDFNRFKKRFSLAAATVVGLSLLLWALFIIWPKAVVTVEGRTEPIDVALRFTADPKVENPQYDNSLLPAQLREATKTLTKNISPTGKKDVGTKATGTIVIKNCEDSNARSLSSGTTFTSSSGRNFINSEAVSIPAGQFSNGGASCDTPNAEVAVSAKENGSSYNISPTSYTTPALAGNFTITGSEMTGGSSKTITVVTQGDVEAAKKELANNERASSKQELANQFDDADFVIEDSYDEQIEKTASNPGVGQEANSAVVTIEVKYSQMAVQREHLSELVRRKGEAQNQGEGSQSLAVVNSGLDTINIKLKDKISTTAYRFDVAAKALLGPDINFDELKERIAGKKFSEAVEIIKTYPNVSGANIDLSPFYVRKVPSHPEKVTIEIKIPEN